jgi:hypothetical protein
MTAPPVLLRPYRLSGGVSDGDALHKVRNQKEVDADTETSLIYSTKVLVKDSDPPKYVYQYKDTKRGNVVPCEYNPKTCYGYFLHCNFQPNNNCYNYACNIASNSFAQPGRMHNIWLPTGYSARQVLDGAKKDGLIEIGDKLISPINLHKHLPKEAEGKSGHYVALMYSPPCTELGWPGDYHWARCDVYTPDNADTMVWSQKDGIDSITDFDYLGAKITDPRHASWKVNEGRLLKGSKLDIVIDYAFYRWMYVIDDETTVNIL